MIKKSFAVLGVLALALAVGMYFAFRARTRRATEQLVQRAIERDGRKRERASHAPEPGTLTDKLYPQLAEKHADATWSATCSGRR